MNTPYSIYKRNRPVKIAFLVDYNSNPSVIDAVLNFNHKHWGGKYNPIILCDGNDIQDPWWAFIKNYDPDLIYSTVSISPELRKKLRTFVTPINIIEDSSGGAYVGISDQPLGIVPTQKNISKIGHDIFDHKSKLVLFDVADSAPDPIKHFVYKNFGTVKSGQHTVYHMNRAIESCDSITYEISSIADLNSALLELSEFQNRSVFFSQLCTLPEDAINDVEYNHANEKFSVIVGDSINDLTHFCNRTINRPDWLRPKFTELWVPKVLAEEQQLQEGLSKFINRFTNLTGNSGQQGVHFSSFSLTESELEQIKLNLSMHVHHPRAHEICTEAHTPKFSNLPFLVVPKNLEPHRASSSKEYLPVEEPSASDHGISDGEYWMTDVYIEYFPDEFREYVGKSFWWMLPQRNGYINGLGIVNRITRINREKTLSIWMKRRNSFTGNDPLIISIPDPWHVFSALYCSEQFDCVESSEQLRFRSRPFAHMTLSDKGKYFNGILSLFPNISSAQRVLEDGFWRRVFEKLSNQNTEKDNEKVDSVKNALKKIQPPQINLNNEDELNLIARRIFTLSKKVSKQAIDLTFGQILSEKEKYAAQQRIEEDRGLLKKVTRQRKLSDLCANLIHTIILYARSVVRGDTEHTFEGLQKKMSFPLNELKTVDQNDLVEDLSDFLENGILFMGIKPRCRRCGYRFWYSVDDMRHKMLCQGCGLEIHASAEEPWMYRLNHLARTAFSEHGTIPVLLTIAQLRFDARSSFLYMPSSDLWEMTSTGGRYRNTQEVDLSCVVDGKLTIGEAKQSVQLFKKKDFDVMLSLAKKVRPDRVIFSSMDRAPSDMVIQQIERLRAELLSLEVAVDWYQLRF